ncbi:MAG TPA: glycosyltransferase [Candidatus Binatia bacterium]|nr:glycosyltransferase [Candidatus Binatia bacterium]
MPLRVTVIGPTPPLRGGIAHYTTALARVLRERHAVQVVGLSRQYPRMFFPGTSEGDFSSTTIAFRSDVQLDPLAPWTWPATARAIAATTPDVIIVAWWQPTLGALLASFIRLLRRRSRARVVWLCHNVAAHDATMFDRALSTYGLRVADAAIVHSRADAARIRREHPHVRIARTTHPAYNLPEFGAAIAVDAARAQLGVSEDVLLCFGLVRRYKGLSDLLRAMPLVLRGHRCTLIVAGEFYEPRAPYESLIRELGVGDHVQLHDRYVPNERVGVYFSAADVLIAPYRAATQSGAVALAQQFHRPAIVTRVGGLSDMIHENVTGLSVEPRNPEALAAAVLRIYTDGPATWAARVRNARSATWAEEVDAIEQLADG